MQLPTFERDAERLLSGLARAWYLHLSGLDAGLPLGEVFERYAEEPWPEVYGQLHDLPLDAKQLNPLLDLAVSFHVESRTARATTRLYEAEAASTVTWRDEVIPLRAVPLRLAHEPDRERRHEIEELAREERARLDRLQLDRVLGRRAAFDELQAGDELSVRASLRGLDLDALAELSRYLLEATAELYGDALRDQLVHHRLDGADAWEADLLWILRGAEYDHAYPGPRLMPALLRTLGQFGIRLDDQAAIRLDRDARPLKAAEAFCAPIAVPDEVIVVTSPFGGRLDYADLFEQAGVAERHAHVDRTQPLALRRLGDPAVIRAYGLLFRRLTGDPAWLATRLEAEATRDEARLAAFAHLHALRRAAAEWLYTRELLATEEPDALAERHADLMSDALGLRSFPVGFLDPAGDPLCGPTFIRAALFAHQLATFLAAEYDETWFASERAGRFLVDRWREGQRYTAEEMARFLGFAGLDPRALVDDLTSALVG
ncbi:MAG: hypothetical protein M3O34_08200 [Chloroflexota bacterium]|nr:hypothetical protein [Chloroflexota bacterium]